VHVNLVAVLLILVAEAFVLVGIALLLRLRNRIGSRIAPGSSRAAPRERNTHVDETTVTRLDAG
jgi:hypothetical protein